MAYSNDIKNAVRDAYVKDGLKPTQIAHIYNVSESTVRSWKTQDKNSGNNWDKARSTDILSDETAEEKAVEIFNRIHTEIDKALRKIEHIEDFDPIQRLRFLSSITDSLTKANSSFKGHLPQINERAVALNVIKDFGDYVRENLPEYEKVFFDALDNFGNQVVHKYGRK